MTTVRHYKPYVIIGDAPEFPDAACRRDGVDPEIFFPTGYGAAAKRDEAAAKNHCAVCPSVRECLAWAMRTGQDEGVWGGMSPAERRRMRLNMES